MGHLDPPDPAILAALAGALEDHSALVRRKALNALGEIGRAATGSLATVREALADDEPDVRQAAAEALAKIEGKEPQLEIGPGPTVRPSH